MKEYKLEDFMPTKAVEQKIWGIFDILRNESIPSQEYYVLLFLLSLYKDGIISKVSLSSEGDLSETLKRRAADPDKNPAQQYLQIYPSFEPTLKRISSEGLFAIIQEVSNLDQEVLSESFSDIFDSVLYQISQSQGGYGGEFIQPYELTRFICGLVDLPEKSKVFNPFAGLASFGVFLNQCQEYLGQEINQNTWALGALRLMASGRSGRSEYVCEDSILNWPQEGEKFDLIVSNPPFGMRLKNQYRDVEPGIRTIEQFLLKRGVNSLSTRGKLIALLPPGFLFRGGQEQRLRKHLINEDLIATIISLPGGLLLNTGLALVVLIIDKDKETPGKVRFIDATKFVEAKSSRKKVLNDYKLNSFIRGNLRDPDVVRVIDNLQIKKSDYNLNVPRYFRKPIEGTKLKEIVDIVSARRADFYDKGKVIRIGDLKDDKHDFKLDLSKVDDNKISRALRLIDQSCLLLTTRWKTLKPTHFEFSGDPIYLSDPHILALKINEKVADIAYLINELHADYVEEQLATYRQGSTLPVITRGDLLEIVIKLPSLEEQRAKIQGIVELSKKIKFLQHERDTLAHGKEVRRFNEFASLKHTLGRPRQNILDWTDNLLHFLSGKPQGFDAINKSFLDFYEKDVISALQEIKRDVNFMTEVLEKGGGGFNVEEYDTTIISLAELNKLISQLSSSNFNFEIRKLPLKGEKMKERGIKANKILLKTLIDNIFTNADKYGFERSVVGNEVVIELKEIDDILQVEFRNNGKPFPQKFSRENFITKFTTADTKSGTGLGGYDIHRIATKFGDPDWELNLNSDPIYPVEFKFQFQIKMIK